MKRICHGAGVVEWVASKTGERGNFGGAVGIGLQKNIGKPHWPMVAGVVYENFNGANVECHIASEGVNWLTREYLWTIFDYPFNQMKAERITVPVVEANGASRRFVEHLGFEQEARLYGAHPSGDIILYVVRKPRVERWLNLRNSHENLHQGRLSMAA